MISYIIVIALLVATCQSVKEYRLDYVYNRNTDAFYKLHTESDDYKVATEVCELEGAKLIKATPKDIVQVHGMLKQFPDIGNYVWAGDDGLSHEPATLNEVLERDSDYDQFHASTFADTAQCEVITREGEVQKLSCNYVNPFICKVNAKDAPYDPQCDVFARGYQYLENVGSCYKISSAAISWNQAYDECQAEGAHLLVLNSEQEHRVVHNLTHHAPKISAKAHSPWYWLAGIRAKKTTDGSPREFKTIFNQTLTEAGFDQWAEGEPNDLYGNELCGSIFTNDGKYNDLGCNYLFAYICEKEIHPKT